MKRFALAIVLGLLMQSSAFATWSLLALDTRTGQVIIASATCVPQSRFPPRPSRDLMDIQAVIVPGVAVAACQAAVDNSGQNQQLVFDELKKGTPPAEIIEKLREFEKAKGPEDDRMERRQFGIIDMQGRRAGHSGSGNGNASLDVSGNVGDYIFYQFQGNSLLSDDVMLNAEVAFTKTKGTLADRVMAAMEGADEKGGDGRCTCEEAPYPMAPCEGKTSHVAYILISDTGDPEGEGFNGGTYFAYISATDQNIQPWENANPVKTLRMRYDIWKDSGSPRMDFDAAWSPER